MLPQIFSISDNKMCIQKYCWYDKTANFSIILTLHINIFNVLGVVRRWSYFTETDNLEKRISV